MTITHEWMISNGFHHHKSTGLDMYTRDGFTYVNTELGDFGIRVQNFINQNPIKTTEDMIIFHKLVSGLNIDKETKSKFIIIDYDAGIISKSDSLNEDIESMIDQGYYEAIDLETMESIHSNSKGLFRKKILNY